MKRLALFVAFAALVALILFFWRKPIDFVRGSIAADSPSPGQSKAQNPQAEIPPAVDASELAQDLNSPTHDIRADLRIVAAIIETYRTNFQREGNPTGNNAEITATLAGDNPFHLMLISRNHPAINRAGELCDRWGTPFFFHAESATQMEIRSAGPDQKLHTADDAVLSP